MSLIPMNTACNMIARSRQRFEKQTDLMEERYEKDIRQIRLRREYREYSGMPEAPDLKKKLGNIYKCRESYPAEEYRDIFTAYMTSLDKVIKSMKKSMPILARKLENIRIVSRNIEQNMDKPGRDKERTRRYIIMCIDTLYRSYMNNNLP